MLELLGGPDSAILVINSSPEAAHFLRRSSSLEAVRKLKESKRRTSRRLQLAFTKLRNGVERGHTPFVSSLVSPREGRPRATETEGRLAGGEAEQTRDRETREGVGGFGDPKRERPEEERSPHFVLSCTLRDEAERETEELTTTEEDKQTRKAQAGENRTGATETRQVRAPDEARGGENEQVKRDRTRRMSDPRLAHSPTPCQWPSMRGALDREARGEIEEGGKEGVKEDSWTGRSAFYSRARSRAFFASGVRSGRGGERRDGAGERGEEERASAQFLPFLLAKARSGFFLRKEGTQPSAGTSPRLHATRGRSRGDREKARVEEKGKKEKEARDERREAGLGDALREEAPSLAFSCSSSATSTAATTPCLQPQRRASFASPRRKATEPRDVAREEERGRCGEEGALSEGETLRGGERERRGSLCEVGRGTRGQPRGTERGCVSDGENNAKREASCCVPFSPSILRGNREDMARDEETASEGEAADEDETLAKSGGVLRRIWCVPPLCCFAMRSERREFQAVRSKPAAKNSDARVLACRVSPPSAYGCVCVRFLFCLFPFQKQPLGSLSLSLSVAFLVRRVFFLAHLPQLDRSPYRAARPLGSFSFPSSPLLLLASLSLFFHFSGTALHAPSLVNARARGVFAPLGAETRASPPSCRFALFLLFAERHPPQLPVPAAVHVPKLRSHRLLGARPLDSVSRALALALTLHGNWRSRGKRLFRGVRQRDSLRRAERGEWRETRVGLHLDKIDDARSRCPRDSPAGSGLRRHARHVGNWRRVLCDSQVPQRLQPR
uniref:Uncharacterized protein n=1 Tax=Neospora caninum (strain Liverpool) TaxID=572307 RepID=A0A0F7UIN2_NEOCL|nr:TPA: hypothetical protein BN1204_037530 [Neospora caninum Liverpool]